MSSLLAVHDFRLKTGPALTFSLKAGQILAVFGRPGSGKTRFLRCLCGLDRGYKGSVRLGAEAALAGYPEPTKRLTPETLARRAAGRGGTTRAAEALSAAGLWDVRRNGFASLTPGQRAAAELVSVLASTHRVIILDGQLEHLDPKTRANALELLAKRLGEGASVLIATSLADLAQRSDLMIVWRAESPSFVGAYAELARRHGQFQFEFEGVSDAGVRALCDPFEITLKRNGDKTSIACKEGQALASRLLLEGYGEVRAVISRPPTPEELLLEVL